MMLLAGAPDVTGAIVVLVAGAGQVTAVSRVAEVSVGVTVPVVPGLVTVSPVMLRGLPAFCQML